MKPFTLTSKLSRSKFTQYTQKHLTQATLATAMLLAGLSSAQAAPIPYLSGIGSSGGATSHGDTLSSDTTFQAGPLSTTASPQLIPMSAACPNIMMLSDGKVAATCVDFVTRQPKLFLYDQQGRTLTSIMLSSGSLLGSVYAYANADDEVMFVNADNDLITLSASQSPFGSWSWSIVDKVSIHQAVTNYCGGELGCDSVVAINPGSATGDVWFATQNGVVGVVNLKSKALSYVKLNEGEEVSNSFSTATESRASVLTNKALYLLVKEGADIKVKWRNEYERGEGRKPGQLSWGSGATPSFFGPETSEDYVTIVDNAAPLSSLLVYHAGVDDKSGELICKLPILDKSNSGTEDSSIAYNNSVVISSTYGYPYPKYPKNAGVSIPEFAPFVGGITRIDVNDDASGCTVKWTNSIRSAALPKLSIADKRIYTVERTGLSTTNSPLDKYNFISIDFDTGEQLSTTFFGFGLLSDPLQTAGNINQDKSYWQGMMNGIVRMTAE